jgi:hypothetical protein
MKALDRFPSERYRSASEMYEELRRAAAANDLLGSPADVSAWVRSAMGDEANVVYDGGTDDSPPNSSHEVATSDGSTIVLPQPDRPSTKRRLTQYAAVALGVAALVTVIFAPNLGPSDQPESSRPEVDQGDPLNRIGVPPEQEDVADPFVEPSGPDPAAARSKKVVDEAPPRTSSEPRDQDISHTSTRQDKAGGTDPVSTSKAMSVEATGTSGGLRTQVVDSAPSEKPLSPGSTSAAKPRSSAARPPTAEAGGQHEHVETPNPY